ncbi:S41 family peptidase [Clostridium vincentii]|uniref:Peptidase family S41 n=1 Tax=Clostridium vincentii TaxID=52704 RepID=A0A2T0BAB4_9CLOT|nr:S41 family peptidase [Clostridium vincentii]PRR80795.1 Peptidase family S41 [Clostridium vincentii]
MKNENKSTTDNTDRNNKWLEDIDFLASQLPIKHVNLFFSCKEENFFSEIQALNNKVPKISSYEICVEISKIVAAFRDAHTSALLPVNLLLPIEVYWFKEGIYIVSAIDTYRKLENLRITHVDGLEINKFINALSKIISYENKSFLKAQLPKYFPAIELLYGLKLTRSVDSIELTLEDESKKSKTVNIEALSFKDLKDINNSNDLVEETNLPLYRKSPEKYYWFEYLPEFKTVYFKYNACRNMIEKDMPTFGRELISFINENTVNKLVIDLRNNLGGNSQLLDEFIKDIQHCEKINRKGNLYVITGRETFSSALLNLYSLKAKTKAIFIGEPTGGKPNCYGEVERFKLKNSAITICHSTKYYKTIQNDKLLSFVPDINLEVSVENFIIGNDPWLEYILA